MVPEPSDEHQPAYKWRSPYLDRHLLLPFIRCVELTSSLDQQRKTTHESDRPDVTVGVMSRAFRIIQQSALSLWARRRVAPLDSEAVHPGASEKEGGRCSLAAMMKVVRHD
jgi:hypothetical protein